MEYEKNPHLFKKGKGAALDALPGNSHIWNRLPIGAAWQRRARILIEKFTGTVKIPLFIGSGMA